MTTSAQLDRLVQETKQAIPVIKQAMEWGDIGGIVGGLAGGMGAGALTNAYWPKSMLANMMGMSIGQVAGQPLGSMLGEKFDPARPYQPPPLSTEELQILRRHLHATHPYLAQGASKEGSDKSGLAKQAFNPMPFIGRLLGKAPAVESTLAKGVKLSGPALGGTVQAAPRSFMGKVIDNPMVQMVGASKAMEYGGQAWDYGKEKLMGGGQRAQHPQGMMPDAGRQGYPGGAWYGNSSPASSNAMALATAYGQYGRPPQFKMEPGQSYMMGKVGSLEGERRLAFQAGVDAFCKEANFDEEDRAALYLLMEKQGEGAFGLPNWAPKTWKGNIGSGLGVEYGSNLLSHYMPGGERPDTRFSNPFSAGQNMGAEGMMTNTGDAMMLSRAGFLPGAIARVAAPVVGRGLDWMSDTGRYSSNYKGPKLDYSPGGAVNRTLAVTRTPQAQAAMASYKPPVQVPVAKRAGWGDELSWLDNFSRDQVAHSPLGLWGWNPMNASNWMADKIKGWVGPKPQTTEGWKKQTGVGSTGDPSLQGKLPSEKAMAGLSKAQQDELREGWKVKDKAFEEGRMRFQKIMPTDIGEQRRLAYSIASGIPGTTGDDFMKYLGEHDVIPKAPATPPPVDNFIQPAKGYTPPKLEPDAHNMGQRRNPSIPNPPNPGASTNPNPGGSVNANSGVTPSSNPGGTVSANPDEDLQIVRRPPPPSFPPQPGMKARTLAAQGGRSAEEMASAGAAQGQEALAKMKESQPKIEAPKAPENAFHTGIKARAAMNPAKGPGNPNQKPLMSAPKPAFKGTPTNQPTTSAATTAAPTAMAGTHKPTEGWTPVKGYSTIYEPPKVASVADKGNPPGSSTVPSGAPIAPGSGNVPPGSVPGQNVLPPNDMVPGRTPSTPPPAVAPNAVSPKLESPLAPTLFTGKTL